MEFEDISARIEWEYRRITAAFGVKEFSTSKSDDSYLYPHTPQIHYRGELEGQRVDCCFRADSGLMLHLTLYEGNKFCRINRKKGDMEEGFIQTDYAPASLQEQMARALYCLGIEDVQVWSDPKFTLSAHEKLELRLSMPREFWPKV